MTTDSDEVRALYPRAMAGWNLGSGEAFAAPFAEDADFVAFDGERFLGRAEIARFHEAEFKTHLKGTRLVGEVTDVRFFGDDTVVMHVSGGTVLRGKAEPARERNSVQTLVAVKRNGVWQLVAFQNTRLRPIGRTLPGRLMWLLSDWVWRWCLPKDRSRPFRRPGVAVRDARRQSDAAR